MKDMLDNLPDPTITLTEARRRLPGLSRAHAQVIQEVRLYLKTRYKHGEQQRLGKRLLRQLVEYGHTLEPWQMELPL